MSVSKSTNLSEHFLFCKVRILTAVSHGLEGAWHVGGAENTLVAAHIQSPMESMAEAAGNSLSAQHQANYFTDLHKGGHQREKAGLQ